MTVEDPCCGSIADVSSLLARRQISPVELTEAMIRRIERLDPRLHSYVWVDAEGALAAARSAEVRIGAGEARGPLDGMPLGIKDIFDTARMPTECGSALMRGRRPEVDAHVVGRLIEAGAVLLGKHATAEFAWVGYPSAVAPAPVNPWAEDRTPGMSSGGSAVAVAASLCFGAFASDTGGSIRFPSAVNGIVGLKPTFGRISRRGVHAFAPTLDHVGPLARTVLDVALLYQAVAGYDDGDPFSSTASVDGSPTDPSDQLSGLRLGVDRRYLEAYAEPVVVEATLSAVERLERAGMIVVPVDLIGLPEVCQHFLPLAGSEALQGYGREQFRQDAGLLGRNMQELLSIGDMATKEDLLRAGAARRRNDTTLRAAFDRADYLALPGIGSRVPPLAMLATEPDVPIEAFAAATAFSAPFNFSGHPTLSLPNGLDEDGLPLGLQLVARPLDESGLIRVGRVAEQLAPVFTRPFNAVF